MATVRPLQLVSLLERTLTEQGVDYRQVIEQFGQVYAAERRSNRLPFALSDHVRGLVLSLLSNQRPWGPIAQNLTEIDRIFFHYDINRIKNADPTNLVAALQRIRRGNRKVSKQMATLRANVEVFENIAKDYGSLDSFVDSAGPDEIAKQLSTPGAKYKLREVGFTLALEYLRNVGVPASKPDVHVRRAISAARLGLTEGFPTEKEAYEVVLRLAGAAKVNPTYLDNLLWLFCAQDYGSVCGAVPRCSFCRLSSFCNLPRTERMSVT
jgi:hypothetical protein